MAYEVVLPRLGWNMESGSLGTWSKQDGDQVTAGEILFTVEGDKATQEVEALESGTLCIPPGSPAPGVQVPVGTLLAYLLAPGEAAPFATGGGAAAPTGGAGTGVSSVDAHEAGGSATSRPAPGAGRRLGEPAISPRARRVARELGVAWQALAGSGRSGRIVERDVRAAASRAQGLSAPLSGSPGARPESGTAIRAPRATPLAQRVAADLGVDVSRLADQAGGGRIARADVLAAAAPALPGERVALTPVRRTIAARMAASSQQTAAVTLTTEVDATELVQFRATLRAGGLVPLPTYNDLLAKIVARALLQHPALNARLEGESIFQATTVNIGYAVDTDRGLLVPVVRDVQEKSLRQVAAESAALIERARAGQARPEELQGGTFTLTNLGPYEIDAFTPIINLPECAVLGVGRIVAKQVVVDADAGQVAIRRMVYLSLTFDHRLVDGAPAARFLQTVKRYVEHLPLWVAELR